ncbi:hypothetical protein ACFX5U_15605 [Sphingobacterium sp. SG20118]|uniref:hypothetical protein n=1 Tax=Sphingobacterium sp. SG20118 TaxID=3367156 RepID=UPI0037DFC002
MPWYPYNPAATDVSAPNNYGTSTPTPPSCGTPKDFLCAIQANDNMGSPTITAALILQIANAVNNRTESATVKLRATH